MDASTATSQKRSPIFRQVCCDHCGYPRSGLPHGALCPECGNASPVMVLPTHGAKLAMTQGEQRWLRTISAGLILLLFSYASALKMQLVMPLEPYTLAIVNMPAPKVAATGLIQRSLGGRPGTRGVAGTIATLGSVLAVWLLTEPRNPIAESGSMLSVRSVLRWLAVLSTGAMTGLVAAWNQLPAYSADPYVTFCVIALLMGCELPVNTLLYLHLSRLAKRLGDERAAKQLTFLSGAVPVVVFGAVALILLERLGLRDNQLFHPLVHAAYGAIAVTTGIIAIAVTVKLTWLVTAAAFESWIRQSKRALVQFPIIAGRIISNMDRNAARWSIVAGIALWLMLIPWTLSEVFWQGTRHASGGDIPYLNFIGPKLYFASVALRHYMEDYPFYTEHSVMMTTLFQLLAVWLMTRAHPLTGDRSKLRWGTRWCVTLFTGLAIPVSMQASRWSDSFVDTHKAQLLLIFTIGCELPATLTLYFYLASVAARHEQDQLAVSLRRIAIGLGLLLILPLGFFAYTKYVLIPHKLFIARSIAAVLMAGSLAVGMMAITTLARLAWSLATSRGSAAAGLSSARHDSSLARADA